jgi:hypothetical protein
VYYFGVLGLFLLSFSKFSLVSFWVKLVWLGGGIPSAMMLIHKK